MLDINQIKEIIPHRYPFLLVDKIIGMDENRIVGQKNVTGNEEYFQGHFPGFPVMPGVLIIEAMAQVGAVAILSKPEFKGKIAFFARMENVRFRQQVVPGDQLRLEVEMVKLKGRIGKAHGQAFVEDKLVAEGDFTFAIGE